MNENQALQRLDPEDEHSAIIPHQPLPPPSLFGATDPVEVVANATRVAEALKHVVVSRGLVSKIQGKEYPLCEAWTLLGTMLGVFPVLLWTRPVEGGWEARVEARTRDGCVVGAAEAQCLKSERNWSNRDDFALRSMAQTRATAKALRMPLGFVMTLAGYCPTPAEEMDFGKGNVTDKVPRGTKPAPPAKEPAKATEKTRDWFLAEMRKRFDEIVILQYGMDKGPPYMLVPGEHLEDWRLEYVPTTKPALDAIVADCAKFMSVEPRAQQVTGKTPENAVSRHSGEPSKRAISQPEKESGHSGGDPDAAESQGWFKAVVPVPYAGMKRDEYLKKPDTIGELYNLRHDDDQARRRLFGFLHNFEPKGWTGRDGKPRPPSESDKKFRENLDAFGEWFEANHPDEVGQD